MESSAKIQLKKINLERRVKFIENSNIKDENE